MVSVDPFRLSFPLMVDAVDIVLVRFSASVMVSARFLPFKAEVGESV